MRRIKCILRIFILGMCCGALFPSQGFSKEPSRKVQREVKTKEYLDRFFPSGIGEDYPKIYQAVTEAIRKLPTDAFDDIIQMRYPVLFTINISSGIARFANSSQISLAPNDRKTFRDGFYMIKLSDELESIGDVRAIEGIVLHELAHRYLNHLRQEIFSCEMERDANRQVKKWGFEEEYLKAKEAFGSKHKGDSPCHDQEAAKKNPT